MKIMNAQQKKNRQIILILFAMALLPFLLALLFKVKPELLQGRTNYGRLIVPPVMTEASELAGFDAFSNDNIHELGAHWLIVNVIPHRECNAVCLDALHKTKQIQLMLNKDLPRTRRVALLLDNPDAKLAESWWQDEKALLRVKPSPSFLKKLNGIKPEGFPDGALLLMDPLRNLMMQYEPGFDPYKVKSDLTHLLKISQIG
jgi:predicted nucleic acid-binding Zn ribbon protein